MLCTVKSTYNEIGYNENSGIINRLFLSINEYISGLVILNLVYKLKGNRSRDTNNNGHMTHDEDKQNTTQKSKKRSNTLPNKNMG